MPDPTGLLRAPRRETTAPKIEVYADISCPFAYVGLRRLLAERDARGSRTELRIRAWPLEWVNDRPHDADVAAAAIAALRGSVAPHLFTGFDPATYPRTTIAALGLVDVAYRAGAGVGEGVSMYVCDAVFEHGRPIADDVVLQAIGREVGIDVPEPALADALVRADWERGRARHVQGSPHFFLGDRGWFCPSLRIRHDEAGFDVSVDTTALAEFLAVAFA